MKGIKKCCAEQQMAFSADGQGCSCAHCGARLLSFIGASNMKKLSPEMYVRPPKMDTARIPTAET